MSVASSIPAAQALAEECGVSVESILFLQRMGWRACGAAHWDHPARPMEQFDTQTALRIARINFVAQCRKEAT